MHNRTHTRIWLTVDKNGQGMTVKELADTLKISSRVISARCHEMVRMGTMFRLGTRYCVSEGGH